MAAGALDGVFSVRRIGVVRTPFLHAEGTPIQPVYALGAAGKVIVDEPYAEALADIEGFERIWLVYWLDRAGPFRPKVVPYRDTVEHGILATRSPSRPNPIGLSLVRLVGREQCVLSVCDVDLLDNTPLLDIKPYVPEFDARPASRAGWLETAGVDRRTADGRFHSEPPQEPRR
jgi:tRNA-Thr(GGU) m(6)t(6)A37 methyltransferase TsaA